MTTTAVKKEAKQAVQAETIKGIVNRRIFYNAENGYCVISMAVKEFSGSILANSFEGEIKASGNMPSVREGDEYRLTGIWTDHPRYGRQFKFTSSELILPTGTAGVARYLSGITYGVGMAKAQKIVDALGTDCLQKVKENPSVLSKLDFLTEGQRNEIAEDLSKNSVQAELAGLICREGIGPGMVARIYGKYAMDSVRIVKENPYVLSEDLWGVGFKKADAIAQTVGIAPNSPYRVEAALNYVLEEAGNEGHVYLEPNDIVWKLIGKKGLIECSGVGIPDIAMANGKLISDGRCIREGNAVYAQHLYYAECSVAAAIRRLLCLKVETKADIKAMVADIESRDGVTYALEQRAAIEASLTSGLSIITGGPGTGKSTVTNAIVDIYCRIHLEKEIYLAAPTGRAAKRMAEVTKRPAKTIHRLLRYSPQYGGFEFGSGCPLPGPGLLIVDEASMIDIELMACLLSAVEDLQVILVGDVDQLPSVGPGSVLRDLIASEKVPTVRLKFNYRQAGGSKIAEYANLICQGVIPPLQNAGDFEYIPIEDGDQAAEVILGLVRGALADGYSQMDFQVLAPMKRGSSGVTKLNELVRELANPSRGGQVLGNYRINDKVMVIKNHYGLGVFNGDIGQVKDINRGILTVDFGDLNCVDFKPEDLEILTLAYASTIHKSQGSEFPIVFMPLTKQHYMMLQRNLLYTGMTRAKKRLVLVGDEWSIKKAVGNDVIEKRFSMLADRIKR